MMAASIVSSTRHLRNDRSGLALLEFAFTLPLFLAASLYGAETANLALVNMKISQIALNLADNASRLGVTPLAVEQLREVDLNDALQAARYQGNSIQLTTRGRIIISSLENVTQTFSDHAADTAPVQRIHWQRCLGLKGNAAGEGAYNSSYGSATPFGATGAGTDTTYANRGNGPVSGMGDPASMVSAPSGSGVVFVEINYNYKSLLPGLTNFMLGGATRIHSVASFIVRDNRDFSHVYNPTTSPTTTASTCDLYTVGTGGKTA